VTAASIAANYATTLAVEANEEWEFSLKRQSQLDSLIQRGDSRTPSRQPSSRNLRNCAIAKSHLRHHQLNSSQLFKRSHNHDNLSDDLRVFLVPKLKSFASLLGIRVHDQGGVLQAAARAQIAAIAEK